MWLSCRPLAIINFSESLLDVQTFEICPNAVESQLSEIEGWINQVKRNALQLGVANLPFFKNFGEKSGLNVWCQNSDWNRALAIGWLRNISKNVSELLKFFIKVLLEVPLLISTTWSIRNLTPTQKDITRLMEMWSQMSKTWIDPQKLYYFATFTFSVVQSTAKTYFPLLHYYAHANFLHFRNKC